MEFGDREADAGSCLRRFVVRKETCPEFGTGAGGIAYCVVVVMPLSLNIFLHTLDGSAVEDIGSFGQSGSA
jgi:hypothetical protein